MSPMANVFAGDLSVLFRLKALEELYAKPEQDHLTRSGFTRTHLAARRAPARAKLGPPQAPRPPASARGPRPAPRDDEDSPGALLVPHLPRAPVHAHRRAPSMANGASSRRRPHAIAHC